MNQINLKAVYGTFNRSFEPQEVTDVTDIIVDRFRTGNKITIPANSDFSQLFPSIPEPGRKFLQVSYGQRRYNVKEDTYNFDTIINLDEERKLIKIVYYIFINRNSNWKDIISGQLQQLKSYGLLDEAELYIHITDPTNVFVDVIQLINTYTKDARISGSHLNQFEYPAIRLVYELAKKDPEAIYIYFHTKGMSYNIPSRLMLEVALLKGTFKNWRKNLEVFNNIKVSKLGLFPAKEDPIVQNDFQTRGGWIWYNFWYARGSYLKDSCEEPKTTSNRYYFEVWLGGPLDEKLIPVADCHNLYPKTDGNYFDGAEVQKSLPDLQADVN